MNFDVFISYPHQDKATADAACAKLEAEGIRCWIAPRDVPPGAEWAEAIVDAIDGCRAMVLIFSLSTNASRQIRREVQQAFDGEKPVVPFRIENVVPEGSLRYYMGSVHWLDALTPPLEQHLEKLAASVQALVRTATPDGDIDKDRMLHEAEARRRAEQERLSPEAKAYRKGGEEGREPDTESRAQEQQRLRNKKETRDREAEEHDRQAAVAEAEFKREERNAATAREAEENARQEKRRKDEEEERRHPERETEPQGAKARRVRSEVEARHHAEEEERRHQLQRSEARPFWPPSRPVLVAGSLVGLALLGAISVWLIRAPGPGAVSALSPEQERALKPKDTFKECTRCSAMIVVPAGSFTMGSPGSEPERESKEGPQHRVTLARQFAVGQSAVTFAEWDACVAGGGCNSYKPSDEGWGRGNRPVVNVSWKDANAYAAWLAKLTGRPYRLLSEAEYEYAARAGTQTAYPWGNVIGKNKANCIGCGSQWDGKQTAPVGSFAPNQLGLYDMVGNVWELTDDCDHDSYTGAPVDGSAWTTGDCRGRVSRGGSWGNVPSGLRTAARFSFYADEREREAGFRIARTLLTP